MKWLLLLLATGCVEVTNDGTNWVDLASPSLKGNEQLKHRGSDNDRMKNGLRLFADADPVQPRTSSTVEGVVATETGPDPIPIDPPTTLRIATFNVHFADGFFDQNGYVHAINYDAVTSRAPVFDIRLDNVYAHSFTPIGGAVEQVDGSDHWPVWFDVEL